MYLKNGKLFYLYKHLNVKTSITLIVYSWSILDSLHKIWIHEKRNDSSFSRRKRYAIAFSWKVIDDTGVFAFTSGTFKYSLLPTRSQQTGV